MIKIKIEAVSGADLRAQLIALLGDTNAQAVSGAIGEAVLNVLEKTSSAPGAPAMEIVKTKEKPAKRLTKAQQDKIAAEEAAKNAEATNQEAGTEDIPSDQSETLGQDNADQNTEVKITLDVLREMILRLSRRGKKEEVKAVIVSMGVERITEFKEEQYQAFFDQIKPMHDALPAEA